MWRRRKLFYPGVTCVMVLLLLMTSACASEPASVPFSAQAKPAEAIASPTVAPTDTPIPTPAPSLTATTLPQPSATPMQPTPPTGTPEPALGYAIKVFNPYQWEAHLFVDNLYITTIPQNQSATYTGIQAGLHTFQFCQAKERLTCAPPVSINITGDIEWEMGQLPTAMLLAPSPTPTATPTLSLPTPVGYMHFYHIVKFNNILPWAVYVFLDEELFLSIPKLSYLTYTSLPTGKYSFVYCYDKDGKDCFITKKVELNTDTEFWIMP